MIDLDSDSHQYDKKTTQQEEKQNEIKNSQCVMTWWRYVAEKFGKKNTSLNSSGSGEKILNGGRKCSHTATFDSQTCFAAIFSAELDGNIRTLIVRWYFGGKKEDIIRARDLVLVVVGAIVVDKALGLDHHDRATDRANPLWKMRRQKETRRQKL